MQLLDTDVLVEIQRAQPLATIWLQSLTGELAIPYVVAWEMLFGSRDKSELARSRRFLAKFTVTHLTTKDSKLAGSLIESYRLSTGLGLPDFLVAAQTLNRRATLFTFNLKHFASIDGLVAKAPYTR
ncbi:MAG TPA: type II toxin-antitoxin system VapC family toxin [Fimbriimonadaceae bacterium]|nr:type II toxin-antitoxin system VapC family toxin [Fimbriimonadaceae bacterium]